MPRGVAISTIARVMWISAFGGGGSPGGGLWVNILEGRISFRSKRLAISQVRKGYVIGVSPSLQIVIDPKCPYSCFRETPRSRCSTDSESISISARLPGSAQAHVTPQLPPRRTQAGPPIRYRAILCLSLDCL